MATNLEGQPYPHIKYRNSIGGNMRELPDLGATATEINDVQLNGHLHPDISVEEAQSYLLDPKIYGPRLKLHGRSRNSGAK